MNVSARTTFRRIGTLSAGLSAMALGVAPSYAEPVHKYAEATANDVINVEATAGVVTANKLETDNSGKLLVRYFNNGKPRGGHLPRRVEDNAPFAKNWADLEKKMRNAPVGTVYRLKAGQKMPAVWKDVNGREVATSNAIVGYGKNGVRWFAFEKKTDGNIVNRGYHGWHDCENPKTRNPPKRLPMEQLHIVESFIDFQYDVGLILNVDGTVKGEVSVVCGPQDWSRSSFSSLGEISVAMNLRVRAKSLAQAKAKAKGLAEGMIESDINTGVDLESRSNLMASGEIRQEGEAMAECSSSGDDEEIPKAHVELDGLNDIDETNPHCDGTRVECESWTVFSGHVSIPEGVSGTLRVSSKYGSTAFTRGTLDTTDDVSSLQLGAGQYDPEVRYVAPTEVPEGGFDTITLTFTPVGGGEPVLVTSRIRINETPWSPNV